MGATVQNVLYQLLGVPLLKVVIGRKREVTRYLRCK